MDSEISKAVLGETLSTELGSTGSYAAAQTHDKVSQRLAKADADLLSDTLNRTLVKWTVAYNLPNAKPPRVWRDFGEQEDLNSRSQRDKTLFDMGYKLKPEAVKEVYGDDYEPIQEQEEVTPEQFLANSGADPDRVNDDSTVTSDTTDLAERSYPSLSVSRSLPLKTDFAEPEKDGIDRYTEQLTERTRGIVDGWMEKVKVAIASSDSFASCQQRIIDLYPDLDTASFADVMGQALIASEAAGRWEVLEEVGGEEDFAEDIKPIAIKDAASLLDLKSVLEEFYADGITGIRDLYLKGEDIVGVFEDKVGNTLTKRYDFVVNEDKVSYKLRNLSEVTNYVEPVDFAAKAAAKPKNCKKGTSFSAICRFLSSRFSSLTRRSLFSLSLSGCTSSFFSLLSSLLLDLSNLLFSPIARNFFTFF